MNKKKIASIIFTLLLGLAGVAYSALIGFTSTTSVVPGVYVVYNAGLLGRIGANVVAFDTGNNWVLVDTHLKPLASSANKKLKALSDQPVAIAFNTHWHPDHSGGNAVFTKEATIVAHKNVRDLLSRAHGASGLTAPGSRHSYPASAEADLPESLIEFSDTFSVDDLSFRAKYYPAAHTNGDIVVFSSGNNVIVVGDLIWPGGFPFVDLDNGGSALGILQALDDITANASADTVIVAGHGIPITAAEVNEYRAMVRSTIEVIQEGHEQGLSLDQIKLRGLGAEWQHWSSDLVPEDVWISMVYAGLQSSVARNDQ